MQLSTGVPVGMESAFGIDCARTNERLFQWVKRLLAVACGFSLTVGSCSAANPGPGWQVVGHRDVYRTVVIDVQNLHKISVYWDALRSVCVRKNYCNLIFFSSVDSGRAASESGRLSDADIEHALLVYTVTKGFP